MTHRRVFLSSLAAGLGLLVAALTVAAAETATPVVDGTTAIGSAFPITTVAGDHQNPAVAYDEGRDRYLVVYEQPGGGQAAACVEANGTITHAYVVGTGRNPDVVYSPDHDAYLIVYDNAGNIEGQFVSGLCCTLPGCSGAPFLISGDRPNTEYGPAVAYNRHANHQDYLVVWTDSDGFEYGVYARQVQNSGVFPGSSFAITYTTAAWNYGPDVAYNLNRNEYLVVYMHDATKGTGTDAVDVWGRLVKNSGGVGLLAENPIDSSGKDQVFPAVAAYRLNYSTPYFVAFTDYWNDTAGDVRGYLVFTTGLPAQLVNVATVGGRAEMLPAVASSEALGGFTLAWESEGAGDFDIYWRRMSGAGMLGPAAPLAATAGLDERYPAVDGGDWAALVVWQQLGNGWDIYARALNYQVYLPLVLRDG